MATLHKSPGGSAPPYQLLLKGTERVLTFAPDLDSRWPRPLHTDEWQQVIDSFAARAANALALAGSRYRSCYLAIAG